MIKKFHQHRYFPHFCGIAVALGVLLLILLFAGKAHSITGIVDIHEHIETMKKAEELLDINRELGIKKTVLLGSPIETITLNGHKSFTEYIENNDELLRIAEKYPENFSVFCTIDPTDPNALSIFRGCISDGGKGLKLYNGHSYYYEIFGMTLNSPRMGPIYGYAERNGIPVLHHVNITYYNTELENVLMDYPDLVMLIPHFMVSSKRLDKAGKILDEHPNTFTDISFGSPEFMAAGFRRISNDINRYKEFFEKYPDRILFGADMVITENESKDKEFIRSVLKCYQDLLEKDSFECEPVSGYYRDKAQRYLMQYEECVPQSGSFCQSKKEKADSYANWFLETKKLNGLDLGGNILKKVYFENAERFLGK